MKVYSVREENLKRKRYGEKNVDEKIILLKENKDMFTKLDKY